MLFFLKEIENAAELFYNKCTVVFVIIVTVKADSAPPDNIFLVFSTHAIINIMY